MLEISIIVFVAMNVVS